MAKQQYQQRGAGLFSFGEDNTVCTHPKATIGSVAPPWLPTWQLKHCNLIADELSHSLYTANFFSLQRLRASLILY